VKQALTILLFSVAAACGSDSGSSGNESNDSDALEAQVNAPADASEVGPSAAADAEPSDVVEDRGDTTDAASDLDVVEEDTFVDDAPADSNTDAGADADADAEPDVADVALDLPPSCSGPEPSLYLPDLVLGPDWSATELTACRRTVHPLVVPRTAQWDLQVRGLPADARLFVYPAAFDRSDAAGDPPPPPLARTDFAGDEGELVIEFVATRSGEHFLVIERDDIDYAGLAEVRAICREGCELETTRYPVVLVHGYAGVDSYFGVLDYFFDIHDRLEGLGYDVYTPVTDAIATSETRAAQLLEVLEVILVDTGISRMNIIAHSQGGLDARYIASAGGMDRSEIIASITTVSTPHRGVGAVLWDFFSVQDFTLEGMAEFNAQIVDSPDVRYWSWSARSCGVLSFGCQSDSDGESIDALLIPTFTLLSRFGESDGIVTTSSAVWGEHLGLIYADHFDQVGQIADLERRNDPFDHRAFYLSEVRRLAAAGY
jgi:triacylglycerol lipase